MLVGLVFVLVFVFFVLVYSSFSWGYVASMFYSWFILPNFPTLPHFTVTQFVGIMFFTSVVFRHTPSHIKDEYQDKSSSWTYLILSPWLTLFFGWLVYSLYFH